MKGCPRVRNANTPAHASPRSPCSVHVPAHLVFCVYYLRGSEVGPPASLHGARSSPVTHDRYRSLRRVGVPHGRILASLQEAQSERLELGQVPGGHVRWRREFTEAGKMSDFLLALLDNLAQSLPRRELAPLSRARWRAGQAERGPEERLWPSPSNSALPKHKESLVRQLSSPTEEFGRDDADKVNVRANRPLHAIERQPRCCEYTR